MIKIKQILLRFKLQLIIALVALLILGSLGLYLYRSLFEPSLVIARSIKELPQKSKPIKDALLLYDLDKLEVEVKNFEKEVNKVTSEVNRYRSYGFLPFVGAYIKDAQNLSDFGAGALSLAQDLIVSVRPYAAGLGFKTKDSKEGLAGGQDRLVGLAKAAGPLAQELPKYKDRILELSKKLEGVDPNRYPEEFQGIKVREKILSLKTGVASLGSSADDLISFFEVLPDLLALNSKRNYLILFQNDKELRPTGGFLTAYAVFTLDNGRIVGSSASDSYFIDIDNKLSVYDPAPEIVKKYLKLSDNKLFFRDSNLSPDFPTSAQVIKRIWNRSRLVPRTDGIVALDTHLVESVLAVVGEVSVPGYPKFTKENVVAELEKFSTVLGTKLEKRQDRKALIGLLMQQILQKSFASGGKQYLSLITLGWDELTRKHVLLNFENPKTQSLIQKMNFGGAIINYSDDYLHVNDANFAGLKANWFMKEEVSKQMVLENDKLITTLKIDYENTGKYDRDLNTGYRDYVRIYVPQGSQLVEAEGSLEKVSQGEDLGKTFFSAYMAVDPLQKARLTVKYETPKEVVVKNGHYRLLIQKQPGTEGFKYEVKIGRQTESFELTTDKEIEIKL